MTGVDCRINIIVTLNLIHCAILFHILNKLKLFDNYSLEDMVPLVDLKQKYTVLDCTYCHNAYVTKTNYFMKILSSFV
jgi:hypothetical protein